MNIYSNRSRFFFPLKLRLTWEVFEFSCFCWSAPPADVMVALTLSLSQRLVTRKGQVWRYEQITFLPCIYTCGSLSSHQRWSHFSGSLVPADVTKSCATGCGEWSPYRGLCPSCHWKKQKQIQYSLNVLNDDRIRQKNYSLKVNFRHYIHSLINSLLRVKNLWFGVDEYFIYSDCPYRVSVQHAFILFFFFVFVFLSSFLMLYATQTLMVF